MLPGRWDVRRAKIFDRCAAKDGIEPFGQLVEQFMNVAPTSAQRVFLVVDNGSAHRGQRSIDRLQGAWPKLIVALAAGSAVAVAVTLLAAGVGAGLGALAVAVAVTATGAAVIARLLDGVTGDTFGAVNKLVEVSVYAALVAAW